MVVFITRTTTLAHSNEIIRDLTVKYPNVKTVIHNVNNIRTTKMLGTIENVLYGPGFIEDMLMNTKFRISAQSFYQINPTQTTHLYGKAIEFADFKGNETVLDTYCGIGTIALIMASKVKEVVGVDIIERAIEDARSNSNLNNIKNVSFVTEDVNTYIGKVVEAKQTFDVVMVDPPRDGLDQRLINGLLTMKPKKIVYISCDPSSLGRDLKQLSRFYNVVKSQAVDMFPQTYHVESVNLLVLK
jgi:23S rRNA (uracil1939-C5)-methyltransferase